MNPLWIVIAIAGIGLAITVADLALKPTFRRLAVRSISRRRGEAALIVVGAMFGTAIIGAALIVGDSFDGSIRDIARTELGPVDIVASIRPGTDIKRATLELEDRAADSGIEHVDGILPMVEAPAVLDNGRRGDRQEIDPSACLAEVDFSQARRFGDDDAITGMADAGATPSDSEVVVSRAIADDLTLQQGDDLTVHLYGQSRVRLRCPAGAADGRCCGLLRRPCRTRRPRRTLGGRSGGDGRRGTRRRALLVLPHLARRWRVRHDGVLPCCRARRTGGSSGRRPTRRRRDAGEGASTRERRAERLTTPHHLQRHRRLQRRIGRAAPREPGDHAGRGTKGGIRPPSRAVGFKRGKLLRSFSLEGSLYSIVASILGAVLSVGVGVLVIVGTQSIYAERNSNFRIDLFVHAKTLLLSAAIGYAILIVTVWLASARVARLNIISAIRDLPDPRRAVRHPGRIAVGDRRRGRRLRDVGCGVDRRTAAPVGRRSARVVLGHRGGVAGAALPWPHHPGGLVRRAHRRHCVDARRVQPVLDRDAARRYRRLPRHGPAVGGSRGDHRRGLRPGVGPRRLGPVAARSRSVVPPGFRLPARAKRAHRAHPRDVLAGHLHDGLHGKLGGDHRRQRPASPPTTSMPATTSSSTRTSRAR